MTQRIIDSYTSYGNKTYTVSIDGKQIKIRGKLLQSGKRVYLTPAATIYVIVDDNNNLVRYNQYQREESINMVVTRKTVSDDHECYWLKSYGLTSWCIYRKL